jgi:hypothetical protein
VSRGYVASGDRVDACLCGPCRHFEVEPAAGSKSPASGRAEPTRAEPKRAQGEPLPRASDCPGSQSRTDTVSLETLRVPTPVVDRVIVRVDGSWELAAVVELRFELAAMDAAEPMPLIEAAGVSVLSVHVDLHQFDATSPDQPAS